MLETTTDKKLCPKCHGYGYFFDRLETWDYFVAVFTLGLSLQRDKIECNMCDGDGFFEVKTIYKAE